LIKNLIKCLYYLYRKKVEYGFLTERSFNNYTYYLLQLESYLSKKKEIKSFDELIIAINDWKSKSIIGNVVKKDLIEVVFFIYFLSENFDYQKFLTTEIDNGNLIFLN